MKNEKLKMSMPVKILKTFRNPLTGRMTKIGETLNVPKERFWFKRVNDKDIELIKEKAKAQKVQAEPKEKSTNNGSK